MQKITFDDGIMFYWQKKLSDLLEESGTDVESITPKHVEVDGEERLIVDIKVSYTAKGKRFLRTKSLWSNRVLTGDDLDTLAKMGEITYGECHFGIYVPKSLSKEDLATLEGLETPDDFVTGIDKLSEEGQKAVMKGIASDWKIDFLSDGVNRLQPSGDRVEFKAK